MGIVAGHTSDLTNRAIALIARDLKPDTFVVTRQNQISNSTLFEAFRDDLCMQPSRVVAHEFLSLITTPLQARFRHEIRNASGEVECGTSPRRCRASTAATSRNCGA